MSRKNLLRNRTDASKAEDPIDNSPNSGPVRPFANRAPRSSSPIPGLIGDAFEESHSRFERAKEIERRLAEGHAVVSLDAATILPSFVSDRMEGDIDGLLASIHEQGQQVPILVRPHPEQRGHYQVAFGHRRLRALKELGLPVNAVVRELSDEQLVIAQGQENNERQDLSFIEKARFAARLRERFSREVITSSMSIDRGRLSKMLSIVDAIPGEIIDAIGSAQGVGLLNWQQLADFIEKASAPADLISYAKSQDVQALPSPDRFKAVLALKTRRPARSLPGVMSTPAGDRLAQIVENKVRLEITIDKRVAPGFAAFVRDELPALYAEHRAKQKQKTGE